MIDFEEEAPDDFDDPLFVLAVAISVAAPLRINGRPLSDLAAILHSTVQGSAFSDSTLEQAWGLAANPIARRLPATVAAGDVPPECAHEVTEVRRRIVRNGSVAFYRQCLRCGESVGNAVAARDVPASSREKPWDDGLRDQHYRTERNRRKSAQGLDDRARDAAYRLYLQSPQWVDRRARVLARNPTCQACERRDGEQAHHMTYERIYCEPLFDLVSVCRPCHDALHVMPEAEGDHEAP